MYKKTSRSIARSTIPSTDVSKPTVRTGAYRRDYKDARQRFINSISFLPKVERNKLIDEFDEQRRQLKKKDIQRKHRKHQNNLKVKK